MTSDRETQLMFFGWLKENRPDVAMADELLNILGISKDSAYRRLRGDTLLTFNEISKISNHFGVSLDTYFKTNISSVTFQNRQITSDFTFNNYLLSINDNLKSLQKLSNHYLLYVAKDIPIFHYFQFPALTSFKLYFWLRTIVKDPVYLKGVFHAKVIRNDLINLTKGIHDQFVKVNSTEIWSEETINVTLSQIRFYLGNQIVSSEDAVILLDELQTMLNHIREEAIFGSRKYLKSIGNSVNQGNYSLYFNEIEIGDNTILFSLNNRLTVFKTYNMLNTLQTSDELFCYNTLDYINELTSKSIHLSSSSENDLDRFFGQMAKKVESMKLGIV